MRVIASGLIYDAATAPARRANNAFTGVTALADGTVLVSFRQGSSRGSADGVTAIYASGDAGETWELRYDGVADTDWEGVAGEMRGLSIRQEPDGTLLGTGSGSTARDRPGRSGTRTPPACSPCACSMRDHATAAPPGPRTSRWRATPQRVLT